eukprot:scaffold135441_cov163-Phaeocystis_antarctica.AAC.2
MRQPTANTVGATDQVLRACTPVAPRSLNPARPRHGGRDHEHRAARAAPTPAQRACRRTAPGLRCSVQATQPVCSDHRPARQGQGIAERHVDRTTARTAR